MPEIRPYMTGNPSLHLPLNPHGYSLSGLLKALKALKAIKALRELIHMWITHPESTPKKARTPARTYPTSKTQLQIVQGLRTTPHPRKSNTLTSFKTRPKLRKQGYPTATLPGLARGLRPLRSPAKRRCLSALSGR